MRLLFVFFNCDIQSMCSVAGLALSRTIQGAGNARDYTVAMPVTVTVCFASAIVSRGFCYETLVLKILYRDLLGTLYNTKNLTHSACKAVGSGSCTFKAFLVRILQ